MPPLWLTGALVVVVVAHVCLLLVVLGTRGFDAGRADTSVYRHEAGLECAACGERNDGQYRFCRHCVAELPADGGSSGASPRGEGRRTL